MFPSEFRPDRLRTLRESKGWTQHRLADLVEVSPSTIGMYERGERKPSGPILDRLAVVLGVPIGYLMGRTDNMGRDDALPSDWVDAVYEAMSHGFTPDDVRKALRAYREILRGS